MVDAQLPDMLKLYSDSACTTECATNVYNTSQGSSGFGHISKESLTYNSIYWNEDTKANKTHTHKINEITDYQPYDDSEVRTLINNKTDKEYVDMWVDKLTADDYSSYTQINDLSERVRTVENRVFDKLQDRYKYKVNNEYEYRFL